MFQRPNNSTRYLGDFHRMGETGAVEVPFADSQDLSLRL